MIGRIIEKKNTIANKYKSSGKEQDFHMKKSDSLWPKSKFSCGTTIFLDRPPGHIEYKQQSVHNYEQITHLYDIQHDQHVFLVNLDKLRCMSYRKPSICHETTNHPSVSGWWFQPLWKYESQLGWWHSQYGKSSKWFQTTNQTINMVDDW